jgi:hypothetical protein
MERVMSDAAGLLLALLASALIVGYFVQVML